MDLISRKDAIASGCDFYFTGKNCINGHISERYTSNGWCVQCRIDSEKSKREERNKRHRDKYKSDEEFRMAVIERNRRYQDSEKGMKKRLERQRRYREENREIFNERAREYANKIENIPKIACRRMLYRVIRQINSQKNKCTEEMLGYSPDDLMRHIESKFERGMSWSNYGEWHIDHINPIFKMIELGITDIKKINALENLRPLWAKDNLTRSRK